MLKQPNFNDNMAMGVSRVASSEIDKLLLISRPLGITF